MAFKGDLKNISLFDVFQTLNTNQQTGVLVLQRDGVTKKVFISPEGVRIFFTRSFRSLRLGEVFVARGLITPQDVEILLLQQKQEYRPMGELLVESGKVSQDDVDLILRYHAEDEIYELFSWDSGTFAFYDGHTAGEHSDTPLSDILLDPGGLCLEAARRLDEIEKLRAVVPNNHEFYAQAEGLEPDRERNEPEVCAVFDALHTPNSVDDLRDLVGLSLYDILRILALLLEGGLIRSLTLDELLDVGRASREAGHHERAGQLLEKAHLLDPSSRQVLEECIESLQRLGDGARLARPLTALGALCLAEGDVDDAIDHLELALRHDPSNHGALIALRDAFSQREDFEHAAEASLKLAKAYSDHGDLEAGIEACRAGLELTPGGIPIRYFLAQLLVRVSRADEAQNELYNIVGELEGDRKTLKSRKVHELLVSCYRLLLKIDPRDDEAHRGMRALDRRRMANLRRKKLAARGAIAAAVLVVAAVIGLTVRGASPEELMERILTAQRENNPPAMTEAIDELLSSYPESPEATQALTLRGQLNKENAKATEERRRREKKLKEDFEEQRDLMKKALKESQPIEALHEVRRFVERLGQPEAAFLRQSMQAGLRVDFGDFLDRIEKEFEGDRGRVSGAEQRLKSIDRKPELLQEIENALNVVRQRNWPMRSREMTKLLEQVGGSPLLRELADRIDSVKKKVALAEVAFASLDLLYHTVRREHLRVKIEAAVELARNRGKDLLTECRFDEAYTLYANALDLMESVNLEQADVRHELVTWMESRHLKERMAERKEEIERIRKLLADCERLKEEGQAEAAYLIMRELVSSHKIVQFERKWSMPYRVASIPSGANVLVNGTPVGKTPVVIDMKITEPVVVRVEREGFEGQEERLVPTDPKLTGRLELALPKRFLWERDVPTEVEARPIAAGDLLLVATNDTSLMAFRLEDGSIAWEARSQLVDRIQAAPAVCGDYAYFITRGGRLHEVRLSDGDMPRVKELGGQVQHDPATDGQFLYVATQSKKLLGLRGTDLLFEQELALFPSTPVVFADGKLYLGTAEGVILEHDAKTGRELRRFSNPSGSSFFGGIAIHRGLVVAGAEDGMLYAFDRETGKSAWRHRTSGPVTSAPVSDGNAIYLCTREGMHALFPGEEPVIFDTGASLRGSPAVGNGFAYVASSRGLSAIDIPSIQPWWDYPLEKEEAKYVVIGRNRVVVLTTAPRLLAFPKDER